VIEIGPTLREARLRLGLTLADVEQRTRIKEMFLAALEDDRFDLLPGDAYARAFLRTYADLLGLDAQALVGAYRARVPEGEQPPPAVRRPRADVARGRRSIIAPLALGAVVLVALIIIGSGGGSSNDRAPAPVPTTATAPRSTAPAASPPAPRPPALGARTVRLTGVGALDPDGDGREHDEQAPQATDGDPATYWATETYGGALQKPGVGLVLDAGERVSLARLVLTTDTAGFTAQIKAGDDAAGPFTDVSQPQPVAATTRFALHGDAARYYVVWITQLDQVAHVNEVRGVTRATSNGSTAR
jgi:transcriptional regulator with XRE-family HTH domain